MYYSIETSNNKPIAIMLCCVSLYILQHRAVNEPLIYCNNKPFALLCIVAYTIA